jgi:ZIP family zinc transporter
MGISFIAGLSTVIGAAFIFALPGNAVSPSHMAFALSLAGGVMISVTVLEFWLPVLSSKDNDGESLARMIQYSSLGLGLFLVLSRLISHSTSYLGTPDIEGGECGRYLSTEPTKHIQADHDGIAGVSTSSRSWRLALVLICSLTAHNFPEGFAVAASSLSSGSPSYAIPLAIAVHNVPEGIAIAVPVMAASGSRTKALKLAFLSGMAEPLGAAVAFLCMNVAGAIASEDSVNNLLCIVGGIMTSVAVFELLPDAWQYGQPVACYVRFLAGCVLMLVSLSLGA